MKYVLIACILTVLTEIIVATIIYGDCEENWEHQLVWEYVVRRTKSLTGYNEVEASYGPAKVTIKCIKIESLSEEGNDSASITSGGLESNYVNITFRSKMLQNLHYKTFVYGIVNNNYRQNS